MKRALGDSLLFLKKIRENNKWNGRKIVEWLREKQVSSRQSMSAEIQKFQSKHVVQTRYDRKREKER